MQFWSWKTEFSERVGGSQEHRTASQEIHCWKNSPTKDNLDSWENEGNNCPELLPRERSTYGRHTFKFECYFSSLVLEESSAISNLEIENCVQRKHSLLGQPQVGSCAFHHSVSGWILKLVGISRSFRLELSARLSIMILVGVWSVKDILLYFTQDNIDSD